MADRSTLDLAEPESLCDTRLSDAEAQEGGIPLNTTPQHPCAAHWSSAQQHAAIALVSALETALTSTITTPEGRQALSFSFADGQHLQAACNAWRGYALASIDAPTPLAVSIAQRATAQISEALFGDPSLDLIEISNRLRAAKGPTDRPLLSDAPRVPEAIHGHG